MVRESGISSTMKPGTTLQTVERALSVLEFVATSRRPPTIKDVAQGLALNVPTVYHLVNTLEYRGYLRRETDGTLRIGVGAGVLHRAMISSPELAQDLHPVIAALAATVEETTYRTSWADLAVVIQDVVEPLQALRVSGLYVGYRGREVQRASGKAVLAHLSDSDFDAVVNRNLIELGASDISEVAPNLDVELAQVRRKGFALDEQGYTEGVFCVAAPYFDASGCVGGSVAVSVPAVRFAKRRKILAAAVFATAAECSTLLGHVAQPS